MSILAYHRVNVEQRSPEWFKWRQWKLGASYAPTIMGENPFENMEMLYHRIVDDISIEVNEDMQRGIDKESDAVAQINASYGESYKPACFESLIYPFLIASVDGWNGNDGIEIKCPRKFSKELSLGKCPQKYYAQCQHCMLVCDSNFWTYYEYISGGFNKVIVYRNDEYISRLIEAEKEFHDRLMTFDCPIHEHQEEWSKLL